MPSIRILVVDDYEDWRNQVRSLLHVRPEWQVVGEALDGVEAVQKAEELRPDLVLLDIGLPTLNGIEAARRIRQVSPNSKILFLTMENSPDVAQTALSTGAQGYVHKARAQSDLLPAIDTVLRSAPHRHEQVTSKRATKRIFQIAYTEELLIDRARLLSGRGYIMMSALGSEAAKALLASLHGDDLDIALFIVGHAAPPQTRREMVDWLKANHPGIKILALKPPNQKMQHLPVPIS